MDAQNEPGVFLGFGHLENTFGAIILVKQSLVVARHNVAFIESVFPFKEKKPSFSHWESLHKLIGRKNAEIEVHDFVNLLPDIQSDLEPAKSFTNAPSAASRFNFTRTWLSLQSTFHLMMKKLKTF